MYRSTSPDEFLNSTMQCFGCVRSEVILIKARTYVATHESVYVGGQV